VPVALLVRLRASEVTVVERVTGRLRIMSFVELRNVGRKRRIISAVVADEYLEAKLSTPVH
jgi:hypothetical protein